MLKCFVYILSIMFFTGTLQAGEFRRAPSDQFEYRPGLQGFRQAGIASVYWEGRKTANGERFLPDGLTAAHRTLRFGTRLRVMYRGRVVVVRINDRGPFIKGRALDLSRGAARAIGCSGLCQVTWQVL